MFLNFFPRNYFKWLDNDACLKNQMITHQTPLKEHIRVYDSIFHMVFFFFVFLFVYLTSPKVYNILYIFFSTNPPTATSLQFTTSWIYSLFHHIVVVTVGILWIREDATMETCSDYASVFQHRYWFFDFVFSYMFFDFFMNWIQKSYLYCFHHVLVMCLCRKLLDISGPIIRFIPHFLLCESSGIFFNVAWFLRKFGHEKTTLNRVIEILFACTFFLTRIVNLCIVLYYASKLPNIPRLLLVVIFPLVFLQFYWFYKIVSVLQKKFAKSKE